MAKRNNNALTRITEAWLERADVAVYAMIAVLFVGAAMAMGVYSVVTFFQHINDGFPLDIITSINDLLLVLIILEVLGTVRSYLSTGTTSLAPFLYIGTISATRRILAIGAATTLGAATNETAFHHQMIDLGANGGVVLALAIALFLFSRHPLLVPESEGDQDGTLGVRRRHDTGTVSRR
jgi:uncharacterized membrane protein (DUF373 family)